MKCSTTMRKIAVSVVMVFLFVLTLPGHDPEGALVEEPAPLADLKGARAAGRRGRLLRRPPDRGGPEGGEERQHRRRPSTPKRERPAHGQTLAGSSVRSRPQRRARRPAWAFL